MWKNRLYVVKDILSGLGILVVVIIPLYAWMTNTLDVFSKGLLVGAVFVAAVAWFLLFALDFWNVNITEGEHIALEYLKSRERMAQAISVEDVELTGNKWCVSGRWMPSGTVVVFGGPPMFGDLNAGKTFEIIVDARTGRLVKYSSSYIQST